MQKQILIEQIDDRVRKGLAVVIELYSKLMNNEITDEECEGLIESTQGLAVIIKALVDIYYNGIENYKDLVFKLAKDTEEV